MKFREPLARSLLKALGTFAALLLLGQVAPAADTADLPAPSERVILRIYGAIERHNGGDIAAFDRAQLEALPQTTVRTTTPWTEGVIAFRGPLARDVLETVGAHGTVVTATAINDYQVKIPFADFQSHDVIMALTRDGRRMRIRDRGPIWIIYPWSDHPELRDGLHHGRSIWQLESLTVE